MEKKVGKNDEKKLGQELIVDLRECDYKIISSKEKIIEYVDRVCRLTKMKRYGKTAIERFGEKTAWGEGYSFFQFIEESSISGHFIEEERTAFINIFSCKPFDGEEAMKFTKKFFRSVQSKKIILLR